VSAIVKLFLKQVDLSITTTYDFGADKAVLCDRNANQIKTSCKTFAIVGEDFFPNRVRRRNQNGVSRFHVTENSLIFLTRQAIK